jgi:hypothetical protein
MASISYRNLNSEHLHTSTDTTTGHEEYALSLSIFKATLSKNRPIYAPIQYSEARHNFNNQTPSPVLLPTDTTGRKLGSDYRNIYNPLDPLSNSLSIPLAGKFLILSNCIYIYVSPGSRMSLDIYKAGIATPKPIRYTSPEHEHPTISGPRSRRTSRTKFDSTDCPKSRRNLRIDANFKPTDTSVDTPRRTRAATAAASKSLVQLARALLVIPGPTGFQAALRDTDSEHWMQAILIETDAMRSHDVFEFLPDHSVDRFLWHNRLWHICIPVSDQAPLQVGSWNQNPAG